ncbi:type VI secretion system baseplate subunit TssE [Gynuella sp.]|uniref:type VI secretion system baseplate subunit TssE n=1 Tax=Gynuella sp. TaxID=2969146 RepID=UPI003D10D7AC
MLKQKNLNGQALSVYPSEDDHLHSIHDHLIRLLNARQGVLGHLPDYGMPDLNRLYQELPYSESDMAIAIKNIVEKYEPRLSRVQVIPQSRDYNTAVVTMNITGWVGSGRQVSFQTHFKSSGIAEISGSSSLR